MKVVRAREERDYKADGNRVSSHRLQFDLSFDSPRGSAGKLTGSVDIRRSDKAYTVGAIRLTFPGATTTSDAHAELSTDYRMSLDELIEFAEGLKAAAILAQDLFKARPPAQVQPWPFSCVGEEVVHEVAGSDVGDTAAANTDKATE